MRHPTRSLVRHLSLCDCYVLSFLLTSHIRSSALNLLATGLSVCGSGHKADCGCVVVVARTIV